MTNEEAIRVLHCPDVYITDEDSELAHTVSMFSKAYGEAVAVAIEALKQQPCEDCISRQAVLEKLRTCYDTETKEYSDGSQWINYEDAVAEMENLPPVTPQPKTGYWVSIDEEPHEVYECDRCGRVVSTFTANIEPHIEYKYCPNCGAKMIEPQESEDKE